MSALKKQHATLLCFGLMTLSTVSANESEVVRIAAASNVVNALEAVLKELPDDEVTVSSGSTGRLYAQITHGAPFDIYIAADMVHPEKLLSKGKALTVQPLLAGRLVLVGEASEKPCRSQLNPGYQGKLALANPKLAPYGRAAMEWINAENLYSDLKDNLVFGQNVSQAWQFVYSKNAGFGLVAKSLVTAADLSDHCSWEVPESLHAPIIQGLATLNQDPKTTAVARFLQSEQAMTIFQAHGYQRP